MGDLDLAAKNGGGNGEEMKALNSFCNHGRSQIDKSERSSLIFNFGSRALFGSLLYGLDLLLLTGSQVHAQM